MTGKDEILVVLDSKKYKKNENNIGGEITHLCDPSFYYTDYENGLVKFFHGMPVIGSLISHISYWAISFASAMDIFVSKRNQYVSKIFVNPIVGIFYCFLLALFNKNDNVLVAGFLFVNKKNKLYLVLREGFVKFAYKMSSKIIVYSKNEVDLYSKRFPSLASKFVFLKYGRDYDIFEEREYISDTKYIASGGASNRDYNALACALEILEKKDINFKCKIATRPGGCSLQCNPEGLEVLHNIRIETFGRFLQNSLFVVIPLKNTSLSAGHMALLEAMYRGKIIIISDVPGIRDYVNDDMVFFCNPDNHKELADKIEYVFNNLSKERVIMKGVLARQTYWSTYSFGALLKRIVTESAKSL